MSATLNQLTHEALRGRVAYLEARLKDYQQAGCGLRLVIAASERRSQLQQAGNEALEDNRVLRYRQERNDAVARAVAAELRALDLQTRFEAERAGHAALMTALEQPGC